MHISIFIKIMLIWTTITSLVGCVSSDKCYLENSKKSTDIANIQRISEEDLTLDQERSLLAKNTIYFGFDRFDVLCENKLIVFVHAKNMLKNPNLRLRIDGHTDERGSREYNVGLAERRAKAVARMLVLNGISENRVITVSYGKEKPASLGHFEGAWSLNRRAEVHYEG